MNVVIADRVKLAVVLVVGAIMVYALYVSKEHITEVALFIGVTGWQAKTAFVLVDLPALIGKVLQIRSIFSGYTGKHGREMTYLSGSISLICNGAAGLIHGSWGAAGWGIFVVVMFLYLESKLTKIRPAASVTRKRNASTETAIAATPLTPRQIAARKGAATRKRNATSPVSPGTVPLATLNAGMANSNP
jgi:hypothetical protein